jgi:hypothetical protein
MHRTVFIHLAVFSEGGRLEVEGFSMYIQQNFIAPPFPRLDNKIIINFANSVLLLCPFARMLLPIRVSYVKNGWTVVDT